MVDNVDCLFMCIMVILLFSFMKCRFVSLGYLEKVVFSLLILQFFIYAGY